jgi:hypothetical protein
LASASIDGCFWVSSPCHTWVRFQLVASPGQLQVLALGQHRQRDLDVQAALVLPRPVQPRDQGAARQEPPRRRRIGAGDAVADLLERHHPGLGIHERQRRPAMIRPALLTGGQLQPVVAGERHQAAVEEVALRVRDP